MEDKKCERIRIHASKAGRGVLSPDNLGFPSSILPTLN
jgi:hypothetical protein